MSDLRTIKKYPNRRLYDVAISSYITLNDIKNMVLENKDTIRVVDAKTGKDLTCATLRLIIADEEENGNPLYNQELLQALIRSYHEPLREVTEGLLQRGLQRIREFEEAAEAVTE